jgi:hypothetical protein
LPTIFFVFVNQNHKSFSRPPRDGIEHAADALKNGRLVSYSFALTIGERYESCFAGCG